MTPGDREGWGDGLVGLIVGVAMDGLMSAILLLDIKQ